MIREKIDKYIDWDREHLMHGTFPLGRNAGFIIDGCEGVFFQDTEGKKYMDASSQLVCVNLGYGYKKEVADAVYDQMLKLPAGVNFFGLSHQSSIECGERLAGLTPEGLDRFYFTTGGSEGTEIAFKMARAYWHKKGKADKYKIISLYDSYHGATLGSLSATGIGKGARWMGIGPLAPGFLHIPSYYCYRCWYGKEYPECNIQCARALRKTLEREGPYSVAAFIAEPVQGVAGMISPPPEYWPLVREICKEYDVLLIADEVMSGFGRTGKFFAVEHWGVKPDIMTIAKGITSAYIPFAAVAFNKEIYETLEGTAISGFTYGAHPVCAAAAVKVMELYVRDRIVENAAAVGEYAKERLSEFKNFPCIGEINGLGLMLGIEIVSDKASKNVFPASMDISDRISKQALGKGLFLRVMPISRSPGDRITFCPPLTITKEEVDIAIDILRPILSSIEPV